MKILYVIFDNVSGDITPIFPCRNDEAAKRQLGYMLSGMPLRAPCEYDLYRLATLDDDDPSLCPSIVQPNRVHVINGAAVEIPKQEEAS